MQRSSDKAISRNVRLALLAQLHVRRGAAASAECRAGILALHQGTIDALRRERDALIRRRVATTRSLRMQGVRQAYAAVAVAA